MIWQILEFNSASQELNAYVTKEITLNQATVDEAKKNWRL